MSTNLNEEFYSRLRVALREAGMSKAKLSEMLGKSERYLEVTQRNKTYPDIPMLLNICSILKKDITYFLGQNQEHNLFGSEIVFPTAYTSLVDTLAKKEFINSIKSFSFSGVKISLEFYLNGTENCKNLYNVFVFTELCNKILAAYEDKNTNPDDFSGLDINLYYPRHYTVNDILSDNCSLKIDEAYNDQLNEFFCEFCNDFAMFREKLFHRFDLNFITKINLNIYEVQLTSEEADNAIFLNSYAYFTRGKNSVITYDSNERERFRNDYKQIVEDTPYIPKIITKTKKVRVTEYLEYWLQGKISKKELKSFLGEKCNNIQSVLNCILFAGLPGVGKSSLTEKMRDIFFKEGNEEVSSDEAGEKSELKYAVTIESSDEYINYKIFDDNNRHDSRESFKKAKKTNSDLYLKIREQTVLSTICKACGKGCLLDLGAKELMYNSILFALLDKKFKVVNIVYSKSENTDAYNDEKFFDDYLKYLQDTPNLIDRKVRENFFNAANIAPKGEKPVLDLKSDKFYNFAKNLFNKRFKQYRKRSHVTVLRLPGEDEETVLFKAIYAVLKNS